MEVYTTKDLELKYNNRMAIHRAVENGKLYEVARGVYSSIDTPITAAPILFLNKYMEGSVVSKMSAIYYQGLHEHMPEKIDIDYSREGKNLGRENELFFLNQVSSKRITHTEYKNIHGVETLIYTKERCLFEAFKIDGNKPGEYFQKVVLNYINSNTPNMNLIIEISEKLGGKNRIVPQFISSFSNLKGGNLDF